MRIAKIAPLCLMAVGLAWCGTSALAAENGKLAAQTAANHSAPYTRLLGTASTKAPVRLADQAGQQAKVQNVGWDHWGGSPYYAGYAGYYGGPGYGYYGGGYPYYGFGGYGGYGGYYTAAYRPFGWYAYTPYVYSYRPWVGGWSGYPYYTSFNPGFGGYYSVGYGGGYGGYYGAGYGGYGMYGGAGGYGGGYGGCCYW